MSLLNYKIKGRIEVGCDEAGRGCLAGPVVAAAVILPKNFKCLMLDDSKKLSEKKRLELKLIIEDTALAFAVGVLDNQEIDEINILNASFRAMHRALDQLTQQADCILVDGNRFITYPSIPHECEVKGDGRYASIAAASILAKTYRDALMLQLHEEFPIYQWHNNKGYPTKAHREAIKIHGACKYHRKTFKLLPDPIQLSLF